MSMNPDKYLFIIAVYGNGIDNIEWTDDLRKVSNNALQTGNSYVQDGSSYNKVSLQVEKGDTLLLASILQETRLVY